MAVERWRPIPGFEGLYRLSDRGRVESVRTGRVLTPHRHIHRGYRFQVLSRDGRRHEVLIAPLVMALWGPPRPSPTAIIGYRDGDPGNCRIDNLCWTSRSEASHRSLAAHGKRNVKLTAADAVVIRRRKAAGETSRSLAWEYRVSYQEIDAIVRGDVWPDQPD